MNSSKRFRLWISVALAGLGAVVSLGQAVAHAPHGLRI